MFARGYPFRGGFESGLTYPLANGIQAFRSLSDNSRMIASTHIPQKRWLDQDNEVDPPLPSIPTHYLCGTQEKLDVMRQRVERGEAVFHPGDSKQMVSDTHSERLLRLALVG